jgi:4'-phosphopantetheinyl transferase
MLKSSVDTPINRKTKPIALPPHEIHLWLSDYALIDDKELLSRYRLIISRQECEQETRFHFARDQRRYLVTRAMVRLVLSNYADIRPECWQFSENEYGRPEVADGCMPSTALCFNVSHTHSLIAVAVAQQCALGIDVENICSRTAPISVANHFFAPAEVNALHSTPPEEQHDKFFEYWTFKEAYIKARGMGLSLPLDKFGFEFPTPFSARIRFDSDMREDPRRWRFWQYRLFNEYLIAICSNHLSVLDMNVVCRLIEPMRKVQILSIRPSRTSWPHSDGATF